MPAVVRITDPLSTGHICASTTTLGGHNQDGTVFADGLEIAVVGAPTVAHPFPPAPPCAPHVANLNAGSPNVFVNGKRVGRVTDSADAGSMTSGSPRTYANGS